MQADRPTRPFEAGPRSLDGLVNVAPGGTATQSSLSPWSQVGEADNAISGQMPNDFAFHTQDDPLPWWQVDLGDAYPIEAIVIHNRMTGYHERARTLMIEIAEQPGQWILVHAGYASFGARGNGHPLALWIGSELQARYVRLSLREPQHLHLSQVEVVVRGELLALQSYCRRHGLSRFGRFATDFGRPYGLERAPGAASDAIVGLKLNHSGRFGNLTLQYTHAIELARRTGLAYVQLGWHALFDVTTPFEVDGLTVLPPQAELPQDGVFISGVFFNTDILAPILGPFLRFDPAEERLYSTIAQTYLRPHMLSGIPLPGEQHPSTEVTIHIRSGDLFDSGTVVERMYRQPPLSFYTLAIRNLQRSGLIRTARLVFEDRGNPCIERLEAWLVAQGIPFRVQCGTLHEDMSALIDAPHLVFGFGTFGYSACRLSKRIETVHFFAPELGGRYGYIPCIKRVFSVSDREGKYIKAGVWGQPGQGEWGNTPDQRAMMVDYPEEWLAIEELPRQLRATD